MANRMVESICGRRDDSVRLLHNEQEDSREWRYWVWPPALAATALVIFFAGGPTLTRTKASGLSELASLHSEKASVEVDRDLVWSANQMRLSMQKHEKISDDVEKSQQEEEEHLEAAEKAMLARLEAKEKELEKERKSREEERKAAQLRKNASASDSMANAFVGSLSTLLGVSKQQERNTREKVKKAQQERREQQRLRGEKEEERENERLNRVEAELKKEEKRWALVKEKKRQANESKANQTNASALSNNASSPARNASGSSKNQSRLVKAEKALAQWQEAEKKSPNISLYCFSLMMPFGYEPNLLLEQKKHAVGIFACNESAVFSNTTRLVTGEPSPVEVSVVNESLAVSYGGRWMTALNTPVFNKLWMEVLRLSRYRFHDWTVKVDPDAVFFPSRLIQLLRHKTPYTEVPQMLPQPKSLDSCALCGLPGHTHETCAAHVRWLQKHGHTCLEALEQVARSPPVDCGCECDDFSCDLPDAAVYLNNCKWGLHGPIEVFSRRAVAVFAAGLPRCVPLLERPWGEDKFIDQCLQLLGINRDDEYTLLSETACGEQPAPCGKHDVSFHPFKSVQSYFTCHAYASQYGRGPAARPLLPNETHRATHHKDSRDAFIWK